MKKYVICAMTALFATITVSIAAPDKDALMAKEKAAWQAFKDKKSDDFKKVVSDKLVAVYAGGVYNLQREGDQMAKTDMKSFDLSDFAVVMTNADTGIVSYKAKVEATVEGKDISGDYNAASVWQMNKGQWQAIFHSDMKAETPASP